MPQLRLCFGETIVHAELNNSQTAQAFAQKLPVTIRVNGSDLDFCGPMPFALPYDEAERHHGWQDGDVNYNPQGGWFAVLHSGQDGSSVYGDQVVMARLEGDDLAQVKALEGSFDLVIELAE